MQVERLAISALVADPANARRHPQRNIDAIMASLVRFGQQKPIIVDDRNVVRAGNGTLTAAKALGWTHIDAVRSGLAGGELAAFAVVDNRTAELAEWDNQLLLAVVGEAGVGDLGFSRDELEQLRRDAEAIGTIGGQDGEGGPAADEAAELGERYEVVVQCRDERQQQELFERLREQGWTCRLLTL